MQSERRRYPRSENEGAPAGAPAGVAAACRVRGIAYRARLSEVSSTGCCAEIPSEVAMPGERVLLQLGRLMVLPAVVRWVAGDKAGLEFANPLHGAMLAQFARRRTAASARRDDLH